MPTADTMPGLLEVIARHWGFRDLRPLQEQAMRAVLNGRDSLVVLPTGGGKSLCYQAPAVFRGGTTVVLSPLIALMKDQVDSLRACGVAAAQIDSSLSGSDRYGYEQDLRQGQLRLLFVSPERLINTDFYKILQDVGANTFAIDEAHCISHWGHDFRPEYRQLRRLREHFPNAAFHAYTATATEQVRGDIIAQLGLRNPSILVGDFDRPNLTYRVLPRHDVLKQATEVLERHPNEAGIVYCLRRRDVDELAAGLKKRGIRCVPYHAGLPPEERQSSQAAFRAEKIDVVVATIAFGMGIDRSNVRFVLHAAMPKSLEHYQQETGRAGRDGLEAECVLLYSGSDFITFKGILEKSAAEPGVDPSFLPVAMKHLNDMNRFARGAVCRHRSLVEYFNQKYANASCRACDVCLNDTEDVAEGTVVAQKILSCVARMKENYGVGQVVAVLRGENTENVRKWKHDKLTTYGLLKGHAQGEVRDWIYQLIGMGVLLQTDDEYPKLKLNDGSWEVMRGQRPVRLIQLVRRQKGDRPEKSQAAEVSWEGVDQILFEVLRALRRDLAEQKGLPPYVVFSDATLRELARSRPSTLDRMRAVYGIGDQKLASYGKVFLDAIIDQCDQRQLTKDVKPPPRQPEPAASPVMTPRRELIYDVFRKGGSIENAMRETGFARSTISTYLAEYIEQEKPKSIDAWVDGETYRRVADAARETGLGALKPIFLALGEKVPYEAIRFVVNHLKAKGWKAE